MKKKTTRTGSRSRRKAVESRGKVDRVDREQQTVQLSLPIAEILSGVSDAVERVSGEAGLLVMKALIDEEVEQLAGRRYQHAEGREAVRWGKGEGFVVFGGKKVPIERPRVRSTESGEIPLRRYGMFQSERLRDSVSKRVLRGVSTRNYEGVIDDLCDGYGIEKSSVSRHWKAATTKELAALMERPLDDADLAVIMVDGISFHEFTLVVALGIASDGKKQVLGIWDGATENSTVVKALLENLVDRGLATNRNYLFVIDGSKALKKGIISVFGRRAIIQRCQIHKERNVLSYLPDGHQATIRRALRAAWGMRSYAEAKKALEKVLAKLEGLSPGAAASLREGLEETLTLHQLMVPNQLRNVLRSTNSIECIFARTRELCRNVKRWSNADMALRWASTMLLHAERKFRRVCGHRQMPALVRALDNIDIKEAVA